nr:sel1 repeat family protein [Endomicrobiaceae bacterium]
LGELYNENLKDLKAEYKITTNFEKELDKKIICYINLSFLKYGKLFFEEPETNIAITKNNKLSFKYFQKSAIMGNSKGQYNLALSYYYGIGIKQNLKLALKYLKKSSKQKNPKAQYALAIMYLEGTATKQNAMAAVYYFKEAVKQNHILASVMLSAMYKFGIKCNPDEKKAEEFINKIKN